MEHNILTVLSYNVFWKGLVGSKTALNNVISNITNAIQIYNPDIFCIQEAEKMKYLINCFPKNYKIIINKSGPENMITCIDKNRFKLISYKAGEFERGRPFCLFLLNDKINLDIICLFNIHASHRIDSQKYLVGVLSKFIENNISSNTVINRFIIAGDFNRDVSNDGYANYSIQYRNKVEKFKYSRLLDGTCCDNLLGVNYKYNYDHIIDTKYKPVKKVLAYEKWYKKQSSDHSMIFCQI